ncbi:hypothetical protein L6Q21_02355 [Sandaracinobacter sp. RS1-74]|uniref:hypothetical protein n=1 Tax=Sandaracinobacteroides sayramensis TaxID=2913411 RepID=UPI001EDBB511|nr:hypothetical protein [Sandaracinobacteroides sayramensis]MCG2839824.1 hypothetical protein [Sandaracinobacteroides sayramensis]
MNQSLRNLFSCLLLALSGIIIWTEPAKPEVFCVTSTHARAGSGCFAAKTMADGAGHMRTVGTSTLANWSANNGWPVTGKLSLHCTKPGWFATAYGAPELVFGFRHQAVGFSCGSSSRLDAEMEAFAQCERAGRNCRKIVELYSAYDDGKTYPSQPVNGEFFDFASKDIKTCSYVGGNPAWQTINSTPCSINR